MVEEHLYKIIIGKLRGLRAENNYSLEEVSEKIDVHRSTLSCYEKGTRTIPLDIMLRLLNFYNVDLSIFFTRCCDNNRK